MIVGTAILGVSVLQRQGFAVMMRAMEAMKNGKPPIGPVVDGAFFMLAGLLLIAPGIITDAVGLTLLVPPLRHRFAAWSVRKALKAGKVHVDVFSQSSKRRATNPDTGQYSASGSSQTYSDPQAHPTEGPVIDGEFERLDERTVEPNRRSGPRDTKRPPPGTNGSSDSYRAR